MHHSTNSARLIILVVAVAAGILFPSWRLPAWQVETPPPLTNVLDILNLGDQEAETGLPVRLECVVTFQELEAQLLFVHDGSAGIFCWGLTGETNHSPGTKVVLTGTTSSGIYAPIVLGQNLQVLGSSDTPDPIRTSPSEIHNGNLDSQWVEIEGVVRDDRPDWLYRRLTIAQGSDTISVFIQGWDQMPTNQLRGAKVRGRGVLGGRYNSENILTGFNMYTPGPQFLETLTPAPDSPFDLPLITDSDLLVWDGEFRANHQRRFQGTVLIHLPGEWMAASINGRPALVTSPDPEPPALLPGTVLDIVGFPMRVGSRFHIEHALWRSTGETNVLEPHHSDNITAHSHSLDGQFIQISGRLISRHSSTNLGTSWMVEGPVSSIQVRLPDPATGRGEFPEGSLIAASGVIRFPGLPSLTNATPLLYVSDADQLNLLAKPESPGMSPSAKALLALLVFTTLLMAAISLRARSVIQKKTATANIVSRELERIQEEKERVAREIHDDVIQSVFAVGMGVEECRTLTSDSDGPIREKLSHIKEAINHLIRDLRGFITGLETVSIQGREFKAALKSMLLTMGDEALNRVTFKVSNETATLLSPFQATELLQISREALTNALRHSKASRITVSLLGNQEEIRLAIEDDGIGFKPDTVSHVSHGLHNMRSRAKHLSALFKIHSELKQGTSISVTIKQLPPNARNT